MDDDVPYSGQLRLSADPDVDGGGGGDDGNSPIVLNSSRLIDSSYPATTGIDFDGGAPPAVDQTEDA